MRHLAYDNEAGRLTSMTRDLAVARAKEMAVIIAARGAYGSYSAMMLQANPDLELLCYLNGTYAQKNEGPPTYPKDFYLRDKTGALVLSSGFGNYLMDPTKTGWIDTRVKLGQAGLDAGYTGVYLDMLGAAAVGPSYNSGAPINPRTSKVYTPSEWLHDTTTLAAKVRATLGVTTTGNGLGSGPRYYDTTAPTSQLLGGTDGGVFEAWLRNQGAAADAWPSLEAWTQSITALEDVDANNLSMAITKTWGFTDQAAIAQWHRFALGTFLLADAPRAAFYFTPVMASGTPTALSDDDLHVDELGAALGPRFADASGLHEREFERGSVLVNPTDSPIISSWMQAIGFDQGYPITVTVGAHDAEVLVRT